MLTARGDAMDRVVGLEIGADDYLPKPFEPRELLARLNAILRRAKPDKTSEMLRFGRLEIDAGARQVRLDGEPRALTSHQFALLLLLAQHAGRVMSREVIMDLLDQRAAGGLRPLDRRAHLAHPRGDRGRSEEAAPRHHGARRRLRLRQAAGLTRLRLYQKIYLTLIASLLLVVAIAGAIWRFGADTSPVAQAFEMAGELAALVLPPPDAPRRAQQEAVERLAGRLKVDLALFDEQRSLIAAAGRPLPSPPPGATAAAGSTVRMGRPGASACRTSAGSWCARRCGTAIPRSGWCSFSAASRWRWRSAPIRWCAA